MQTSKRIAVYGTLKKGFGNHRYLKNSRFLGTHETEPKFTMFNAGFFPFVSQAGNTSIKVEVYDVNDADINGINRLEGYTGIRGAKKNWYDTVSIDTPWGEAEMFINNRATETKELPKIKTGEWGKNE